QGNAINSTFVDNLSDAVICAFLASQPNSPQLAHEDLEQIHPDDMEEMDLKWEMAMLPIRARRFIKRTWRNLDMNGQIIGFDRALKNQENKGRDNDRRTISVENTTQNSLIAQDGIGGYDWSYQAEEEHPTNYALMAYTSSGNSSNLDYEVDSCSKSCVKGLQSVETRLAHYKKNEAVLEEKINVLNLEVNLRDNALVENKKKLEKAEKERDQLKQTLEKFQNSSKSVNDLLESQVIDNFKTGLGYNATTHVVESFVNSSEILDKSRSNKGYHVVPQPLTGTFMAPKPDLMFIDKQVECESLDVVSNVTSSDVKTVESKHESIGKGVLNTIESNVVRMNNFSALIIKDWISDDESEVEPNDKVKTVRPSNEKRKTFNTARETVEK
ncbi:hypothetical protein Tco_1325842, partial [Tanacetum coccineum]